MSQVSHRRNKGVDAALASAFLLGLAPVFGKLAINFGMPGLFVVAARTTLAVLLLFTFMLIFKRPFLYIYPAGLLGCILAGWINGIGSLLYYSALERVDASLGQVIYSLYPLFVALWLWLDRQQPSRLTILRLFMIIPALLLLTRTNHNGTDILGILMMLLSSALFALHLPINQRVLLDMPAPTVTLYTLLAMSATVMPAFFFVRFTSQPEPQALVGILGLTTVTFLSRLTLFTGVKHIGGLQTALLGVGELLVTIVFSHLVLKEQLNIYQWIGVILLMSSLVLVRFEKPPKKQQRGGGWLSWLRPPGIPTDIPWQPHD
jgi:drug/metabolite transporter (DMT)-like permease